MRDNVHTGWVQPQEEWLTVLPGGVQELERVGEDLVVHRFHAFWAELAGIFDSLLPYLAPAWLHRGVVRAGRPAMNDVARAYRSLECRRVVGMTRVLHRIQVIEVTVEFVEAMQRGQEPVQVAKMVQIG